MNYLPTIFIFLFTLFTVALFSFATLQLWQGTLPVISWLGLWLAAAAPLLFLMLKRLCPRYTQSLQPIGFSILCGLGLAITMTSSWKHGEAAGHAHIGAGICLLLWFIYLRWVLRKPNPGQSSQVD